MGKIKKQCPRCQAEFYCHQDKSCWCVGINIPKKISDKIRAEYADCLCKQCLLDLGGAVNNIKEQ